MTPCKGPFSSMGWHLALARDRVERLTPQKPRDHLGLPLDHCHLGLATLHTRSGRPEQARLELSTAIALYHAMDMTFWLPQAKAALAQTA